MNLTCKNIIVIALLGILYCESMYSQNIMPTKISKEESEILVLLVPDAVKSRLANSKVHYDCILQSNKYDKQFYIYWVIAAHAVPNSSPTLGYYAVNKYTGTVWNTIMNKRVHSSLLQDIQAIMRWKHHINNSVLKKYRMLRP